MVVSHIAVERALTQEVAYFWLLVVRIEFPESLSYVPAERYHHYEYDLPHNQ